MIPVHRLTHPEEPVYVNPDLIQMLETTPDTVVTMTNASKLVVAESVAEVTEMICAWRARILSGAFSAHENRAAAGGTNVRNLFPG
jgi:flagellar protein FlbD